MGNLSRQRGSFATGRSGVIANASTGCGAMQVENTLDGWISVEALLTLGSLTNMTVTPMVSMDGSNWRTLSDPGALGPLTASGNYGFACNCKGWKWFQVFLSSTGTTTSSAATVNYRWSSAGGAAG